MRHPITRRILLGALCWAASAHATNDTWATRTVIPSLPYQAVDAQIASRTNEVSDPETPCLPAGANPLGNTVWYSYTTGPSVEYVTIGAHGNNFLALAAVYTGTPGSFRVVTGGCGSGGGLDITVGVHGLRLQPNTEYTFLVGAVSDPVAGGTLTFDLQASVRYQVTKTDDTNDGLCDADCSLREAIGASNANPGAVLIPAGNYLVTRFGVENANASGDFDIACGMGIYGAGMDVTIIDGGGADAVLDFDRGVLGKCTLTLGDLTLTHGSVLSGPQSEQNGGGLRMTLNGVFPDADFIGMERVRITNNNVLQQGSGAFIVCPAQIRDSRIDHNLPPGFGGGIYYAHSSYGFLDISGTTFDHNESTAYGGGLMVQGGSARIVDSTFSDNHANIEGGGIYFGANDGTLFVGSSTIAYNTGPQNLIDVNAGAGIRVGSGNLTLVNSIVANNSVANPDEKPDCVFFGGGTLTSHHNLVEAPAASCALAGTGDVTGVDPKLAPVLDANGGPTPTIALPSDSLARDSADPSGCKDATGAPLAFDQRGATFARALGTCDKGAYEFGAGAVVFSNGFE